MLVHPEGYGVPEGDRRIPNAKIIIQDKNHYRFGGHKWLRGLSDTKITKTEWQIENFKIRSKNIVKQIISFFRRK